ncbi:MAG: hypothetical protein IJ168_04955 [Eubacterium sp.]|nr:hypothetical protein [Eubacterium sp.]
MANSMTTSSSEMERIAGEIDRLNDEYTGAYKAVFNSFKSIDAAWDGDDHQEFYERVITFEKDFLNMTSFFTRVSTHLKLSAKAYLATESATEKAANKLAR